MIPSLVTSQLRATVLDYLHTTFSLADKEFEGALFGFLDGDDGLFRGPFVDIRLPFRKANTGEVLPLEIRPDFSPYKHQLKSFQRLYSKDGHQPQHTLVTTGTGSGKTECFLYPILDHCYRNRDKQGIKAIILYPMNALASDQAKRLAEILWTDDRLKGNVSAGLYVGGVGHHGVADKGHLVDKRDVLRDSPPDILLTNYKMLDFLLMRPEDRRLWARNETDTLRYLVLDELHTYDGAQGSDVACLIRRLKNRLESAPSSICCVGTSATIGDATGNSASELTKFASKVFDETFFDESLVTEDRLSANETFPGIVNLDHIPVDVAPSDLDANSFDDLESWLEKQVELWFGNETDKDPLTVGQLLARHELLRDILKCLNGRIKSLPELDSALARRNPDWGDLELSVRYPLLDSYLGLISFARREEADRQLPFLTVQIQLWIRELRHLLRLVQDPREGIGFIWASDLQTHTESDSHWLPIAYCRECGQSGLASSQIEGQAKLESDRAKIGRAWWVRNHSARYLKLGVTTDDLAPTFLDPEALTVGPAPQGQDSRAFPALIVAEQSQQIPPRFLGRCPDCGGDHDLSILGSRAPSLLSVVISDSFSSQFNSDKKLLAFTDSVQDASHRAGFFGARTYRFNLRTAMQAVVEHTDDPVPLMKLGAGMITHWGKELKQSKLIATLLPADLKELPDYRRFQESGGGGLNKRLINDLTKRLSWEATMEFGLRSHVGRTLTSSRCSTAIVDQTKLSQASANLCLILNEDRFLESAVGEVSNDSVRHFLSGLIERLRSKGGIYHKFLKSYMESGGKWFHLTRQRNRLISPFGSQSVFPKFWINKNTQQDAGRKDVFDCVFSNVSSRTWYRDWAARSLGLALDDQGINDLYREAVSMLTQCELLLSATVPGQRKAWGLNAEHMFVTGSVAAVVCAKCNTRVILEEGEADQWNDRRCTRYRCDGVFEKSDGLEETYYSRIFRSGRLHRIFSGEHTGLLGREERELLEERFKTQNAPDAENLVVATPTLEMGIDIGDLSATVLCSVPPTVANYLQRVGRAGRKTGNAICVTLANARPHDLYFNAQPMEMLEGDVLPPGCFLNAPEMLSRQMLAHAMDSWAREVTEATAIPRKTSYVLSKRGWPIFPGGFLEFYREHRVRLTDLFLRRFGAELSFENTEALRLFGQGDQIIDLIEEAFDRVRKERKDLRSVIEKTNKRIKSIEAGEEELDDVENELRDLQQARAMISRLVEELDNKYPLNVLTDESALPNYAFPEAGVSLDSVLKDEKDDGSHFYETRQFVRPASSAIRELAPYNTFYAEGRKVLVDEIDIGSRARPLTEQWRFCAACSYSIRELDDATVTASCPRCSDDVWGDAGQHTTMVNFRRSRSLAGRLEASTFDDSDDRDEEHYVTMDLIDVGPDNFNGAKLISELPFGYELLRDLALREVNFGKELGSGKAGLKVAGLQIGENGFPVCLDCGRVQLNDKENHAPYCRARKNPDDAKIRPIFLYRELESEGIRILLPVSEVELEESRSSFKAALDLGFRRHFQGAPGHLQIKYQREPVTGGGYRQYLLVFDAVPGGTGYLSELWREDVFLEVLEKSLTALQACSCQRDPDRDGCYSCIFAYQRQNELANISSRRAQATLQAILDRRNEFESVTTLSEVTLDSRLESELEEKFVRALSARVEGLEGGKWTEAVKKGDIYWRFITGGQEWEMHAQQDLGRKQGVSIHCRPDFIISSTNQESGFKPVAVFCDGLAYHACPDREEARIWDDIEKRQSIIASGNYQVWSLTWKDVEDFQSKGQGKKYGGIFENINNNHLGSLYQALSLQIGRDVGRMGSFAMLFQHLQYPDMSEWNKLAQAYVVAWLATGPMISSDDEQSLRDGLHNVQYEKPIELQYLDQPGDPLARIDWREHFAMLAACSAAHVSARNFSEARMLLRLFDAQQDRVAKGFEKEWRQWLHAWNLLQFLDNVDVTSTELLERSSDEEVIELPMVAEEMIDSAEIQAPVIDTPAEILDFIVEAAKPLVQEVLSNRLLLPEVEYELAMNSGRCGPTAELAWPDVKICVLFDQQLQDKNKFQAEGWVVFTGPLSEEAIHQILENLKS